MGRDLGLRRVSKITRWSLGGAVILTGALSVLVAQARPGHAKGSATTSPNPSTSVAPTSGDNVLQPPPTGAPAPGSGGGLVTSGAS